jgi:hypothetical protein
LRALPLEQASQQLAEGSFDWTQISLPRTRGRQLRPFKKLNKQTPSSMDIGTLYRKINAVQWYHRFELLPGVFAPGKVPTNAKQSFSHFQVPQDLTGIRVQ